MFRIRTTQERMWEVLPGLQIWTVFIGAVLLSFYKPVWAALFIICFDLYFVLKAVNVALHLIASYRKFRVYVTFNWFYYVEQLSQNPENFVSFLEKQAEQATSKVAHKYFTEEVHRLTDGLERENFHKDYKQ